jgi:hypothetical protein
VQQPLSDEAQGQGQLDVSISVFVVIGEVLKEKRDISALEVAPTAQLARNIHGHVLRPMLGGVEGDDAAWVVILAGQQITLSRPVSW